MRINRLPYSRQYRHLFLPLERALNSPPPASYDYSSERIDRAFRIPSSRQIESSPQGKRRTEIVLLAGMCLLIGVISAYDTYMLVRFQETIVEENPVGRWLMDVDNGSVALFVGCKFAGTIIVLAVIAFLYIYRESMALCVAATLSLGQVLLFWYVTFF